MSYQQDFWSGVFGDEYNGFADHVRWEMSTGMKLTPLMADCLSVATTDMSVMDYGCGDGLMLTILKNLNFKHVSGVDINAKQIEKCREKYKEFDFTCSSVEDFEPKKHDISLHSGLLIHMNPNALDDVMRKIYENTNKFIIGKELSTPLPEDIGDRSRDPMWHGKIFTRRWMKKWKQLYPDLHVIKHKLINSRQSGQLETEVFVLQK
jgi:SAM-dependent methyltransferase